MMDFEKLNFKTQKVIKEYREKIVQLNWHGVYAISGSNPIFSGENRQYSLSAHELLHHIARYNYLCDSDVTEILHEAIVFLKSKDYYIKEISQK